MNAPTPMSEQMPWSREEFEANLRAKGDNYHINHPFNIKMNEGKLTPDQIRGWVYNRFYYQVMIPIKDAAIMSNCPDRDVRRKWVERILDHDGHGDRKSTRLNSSHVSESRMPSSA